MFREVVSSKCNKGPFNSNRSIRWPWHTHLIPRELDPNQPTISQTSTKEEVKFSTVMKTASLAFLVLLGTAVGDDASETKALPQKAHYKSHAPQRQESVKWTGKAHVSLSPENDRARCASLNQILCFEFMGSRGQFRCPRERATISAVLE